MILDKLVYAPVGEVLDKRDTDLKSKLASVKDNSGELDGLMVRKCGAGWWHICLCIVVGLAGFDLI